MSDSPSNESAPVVSAAGASESAEASPETPKARERPLAGLLTVALDARRELFDDKHETAFRLFNGFLEGLPGVALDLYGSSVVVHSHVEAPDVERAIVDEAVETIRERLPWVRAVVLKPRRAADPEVRRGRLVYGDAPERRVRENGVWYAIDLLLNRDASFYLDTRNVRAWAKASSENARVLNAFAYTGSLGVAAYAGGARGVTHLDLSRRYLNVAKTSYTLNGFAIDKAGFVSGDFWVKVNALKRAGALFDTVFVDPPFFSATRAGTVDLVTQSLRVINKIRPLVADGGRLVAINNALFVSGAEYMSVLEQVCADGYLSVEGLVPVPEDFTGYAHTRVGAEPVDAAPFNHSTKIAVLAVRRKDSRTA